MPAVTNACSREFGMAQISQWPFRRQSQWHYSCSCTMHSYKYDFHANLTHSNTFFKLQCLCVWQLEYQTAKMAHKNHKPWQVFKRNQIFLKSGWVLWLSLILNVLKNSDSCCSYCIECEKIIFHFTVHDYVDAAWVGYLFFLSSWPLSFLPWFRFFVLKM